MKLRERRNQTETTNHKEEELQGNKRWKKGEETISDAGTSLGGLHDLTRSDGKKLLLSYLFASLQVFQKGFSSF